MSPLLTSLKKHGAAFHQKIALMRADRIHRFRIMLALCGALFLVYAACRQRYIWGVDSFGYYQLGALFSEGRVYLDQHLASSDSSALVPLGFSLNQEGRVAPGYPPGFPLFIAIGHLLRMPMLVTPFLGVISCVLIYRLIRVHASAVITLLFTIAWAFMPLTVYGSTYMMSDLVAATTLMAALLAWRNQRVVATAWMLGLSFAVRPTNVLILLPFACLLQFNRTSLRLVLHLAVPCTLYACYNYKLYGAPWLTGYGNITGELKPEIFQTHFWFYLKMTGNLLSPAIVLLAVIGAFPLNREKVFLLLWPLVLMVFFAHWAGGGIDRWWWARFILPGYPAIFLLAAQGFQAVTAGLRTRSPSWCRPLIIVSLHGLLLAVPVYYIVFGVAKRDLWIRDIGEINFTMATSISAIAPPGSLFGSVELASTCFLYTRLTPFVSVAHGAAEVVGKNLAEGRRAFLLVEPWNAEASEIKTLLSRFHAREVKRFDQPWPAVPLYELTEQRDFGPP